MIDAATPTREQILAQLMQWLPGVYRARDAQANGVLQAYLSLFADELWRMRQTVEQAYADHFIDSAQTWVIPYLAELVGTEVLFTGEAAQQRAIARLNREDVKNTIHRRRHKGTLGNLQELAHGVGGWGAHAQEMFERVAWMQNLTHIKPQARFALDLRDGENLARALTPFSRVRALTDLRTPDARVGWYQTRNVCVFEWPIAVHPLRAVTPRAIGNGRHTFHPMGLDTTLFAACNSETVRAQVMQSPGASGADIGNAQASDLPIRTRDLHAHAAAYTGTPLGFTLREDGICLLGGAEPDAPLREPCLDYAELATARGMLAADTGLFAAPVQFEVAAARMAAVLKPVNAVLKPVTYSPGQTWATQFRLVIPHGVLKLDAVASDFSYTPGGMPYQPDSGEYHHAVLLLQLTNNAAGVAAFPESELIVRNARGNVLQITLPAVASLAGTASIYFYVAADGSTYFARADHLAGTPDRNPDSSMFGAYSAAHLARASVGQRRIRPGHPAGAARYRRMVARDLCCWDKQPLVPSLASGEVAIDPQRGRIAFPTAEIPKGELSADFHFGLTAGIGAGPFARAGLPPATRTVAKTRNADFSSVQAAINAPNAGMLPVVIEILDSAVYEEAIVINNRSFPGGLLIQASALQSPLLRKPGAALRLLSIINSNIPVFALDGLMLSGGEVRLNGGVGTMRMRSCSLQPSSVTVQLSMPVTIDVQLEQCISGPLTIVAPGGRLTLLDSVVQHPAVTIEAPQSATAISFVNGTAALEKSTLLGSVEMRSANISNTLCYGAVLLADTSSNCLRFSRLPASLTSGRAFRCTQATPVFVSINYGDAGYMHLHPNTAAQLLRGGEEGGEIGAFASAGLPWRTQNTGLRLNEYIPAGLVPVQIRALPRPRFLGNHKS